jgi:hypothetical protein
MSTQPNDNVMDLLERCNEANEHLQEMLRLEQAARAELEAARIAFRLLEVRELLAGVPGSNEAARRAFIENEHEGAFARIGRAEAGLLEAKLERETAELRYEMLQLTVTTLTGISRTNG